MTGSGIDCSTCGTIYGDEEMASLCCSLDFEDDPISLRLLAHAESSSSEVSLMPDVSLRAMLRAARVVEGRVDSLTRLVTFRDGAINEPPAEGIEAVVMAAADIVEAILATTPEDSIVPIESKTITALSWAAMIAVEAMPSPLFDIYVGTGGETASATITYISPRGLYVAVNLAGTASVHRADNHEDALHRRVMRPMTLNESVTIARTLDDDDIEGILSGVSVSTERWRAKMDSILSNFEGL